MQEEVKETAITISQDSWFTAWNLKELLKAGKMLDTI
jgi:hypothetical protein